MSHMREPRERHRKGHGHQGTIAEVMGRFRVALALTIPILAPSPHIQQVLGVEKALASATSPPESLGRGVWS